MIRQDFEQMPPRAFIEQIACNVLRVYLFLWDRRNKDSKVSMDWKKLSRYFNKNVFRTSTRKLCDAGLLDFTDSEDGFSVELVNWEEIED